MSPDSENEEFTAPALYGEVRDEIPRPGDPLRRRPPTPPPAVPVDERYVPIAEARPHTRHFNECVMKDIHLEPRDEPDVISLRDEELKILHLPRRGPGSLSKSEREKWRKEGRIEEGGLEGIKPNDDFRPGRTPAERFDISFFSLKKRPLPPRMSKQAKTDWRKIEYARMRILADFRCSACRWPTIEYGRPR
jgi:hypothetical protein